jgi:hypothetical protein
MAVYAHKECVADFNIVWLDEAVVTTDLFAIVFGILVAAWKQDCSVFLLLRNENVRVRFWRNSVRFKSDLLSFVKTSGLLIHSEHVIIHALIFEIHVSIVLILKELSHLNIIILSLSCPQHRKQEKYLKVLGY